LSRDSVDLTLRLDLEVRPRILVNARERVLEKGGRRPRVESERTRDRGAGKGGKAARRRGAAEPKRKPFRVHERKNATKPLMRVLIREREGDLPVLTLESTQPPRMVVDKPVRVIRNKAIPARVGFEINLDDMCARAS
jgi:hypothetical protein